MVSLKPIIVLVLLYVCITLGACPPGFDCSYCACDVAYGNAYSCRSPTDHSCCSNNNYYDPSSKWPVAGPACGNNRTECEPCDDGNTLNGDGCSANCTIESGYTCLSDSSQRSTCTPICSSGCGNGTCASPNTCKCNAGYIGAKCDVKLSPGATTCTGGQYCGWCGCDAMYGAGYTCRTSSDHSCCWGNNNYETSATWPVSGPYCGNNRTECEPCDDGNTVNGDGCSSTCTIEAGYSCTTDNTQRSTCTPVCSGGCGNGTCVSPNTCKCNTGWFGAQCNTKLVPGATTCSGGQYCGWCGCDAMYGPGYTCRTSSDHSCCWGNNYYETSATWPAPGPYCGNNRTECEPCDDGNTVNGDGCSSTCTVEPGYSCPTDNTQRSTCSPICTGGCGNGTCVSPNTCKCNAGWIGAKCDVKLSPGATTCTGSQYCGWCGCDAMYGTGYTCRSSGDHTCCWGNNYYETTATWPAPGPYCGNNRTECEPCDDGNTVNGDGCSSTCTIEAGYSCITDNTQRSTCSPICTGGCGNGTCTSPNTCKCNSGWFGAKCDTQLTPGATTCTGGQFCGWCGCDAMYGPGYTCRSSGDHTCCWGNNYYETTATWPVPGPSCGNNRTECEPCDDGNTVNGDGCSSTCTVEAGYSCPTDNTQRSTCSPICSGGCGNGTCASPNKCKCNVGWGGTNCNIKLVPGPSTCTSGQYCGWCGCDAMYGPGYTCRTSYDHSCCWNNNYYEVSSNWPVAGPYCGNGRNECEPCDDGNIVNGDGCSSTCAVESGWRCNVDPNDYQKSNCTKV